MGWTVLMTTFNGDRFLDAQLKSIIGQTLPPDRILVLDDGSADGTVAMMQAAAQACPVEIVVDAHEHLGLAANIGRGLTAIDRGPVALADQDDIWSPTKLERLARHLVDGPRPQAVFSDGVVIDRFGNVQAPSLWRRAGMRPRECRQAVAGQNFSILLRWNHVTGAAMAFNTALLELALPLPDPPVMHDAWLALLAAAAGTLVGVPDPLIRYRLHSTNVAGLAPTSPLDALHERNARDARGTEEGLFMSAITRLRER
jgi:glycosyltransferase involved in cell wall biosynthesis